MTDVQDYTRSLDLSGKDGAFSAACALYWYCTNWHQGQSSDLYSILSKLDYRPGALEHGPDPDGIEAIIYSDLEAKTIDPRELAMWIEKEWAVDRD